MFRQPNYTEGENKIMGRLAIIEIQCPLCGKTTKAILPDDASEREAEPEIKCEECGQIFKFTSGLLYRPIGYAPENTKGQETKPQEKPDPYHCMICGRELDFGVMVPDFWENTWAYHCDKCLNSICYPCTRNQTCIVCGCNKFEKTVTRTPPLENKNNK